MNKATTQEIPEIRSLWQEVFGDSEVFINRFVAHFGIENCYVSKQNGEIAAMLFALPVAMGGIGANNHSPVRYIYACATRPKYRSRGIMEKLLETVYQEACSKNVAGIFLYAANQGLENYYRKLGFVDFFYQKTVIFNRKEHKDFAKDAKSISISHSSFLISTNKYRQERVQRLENTCFVNWDEDFFRFLNEEGTQFCEIENTIFSFKTDSKKIIVDELLGNLSDVQIAHYLFEHYPDVETIEIRSQGNETCCGQIKWCNLSAPKPQSGYFAFAME
jgi:predicted acetyltransferase